MNRQRMTPFWAALLVAACADQPSAPQIPEATDPQESVRPSRSTEGFRSEPDEVRTGWIVGRGGRPQQVTFAVHDGLAVWEGDILLGPADEVAQSRAALLAGLPAGGSGEIGPDGAILDDVDYRWLGGRVPYYIDDDVPAKGRILDAIEMIENSTHGVNFVAYAGDFDHVVFARNDDGCSSPVGREGYINLILIDDSCMAGSVVHEILHTLGMYHEQSRCDRNTYVAILEDNIEDGKEHNFERVCDGASDHYEYDEGSIMHYPADAFSRNGQPTIYSLRGRDDDMGQRSKLGSTDIQTVTLMYGVFDDPPDARIAALQASYPEGTPVMFDGSASSDIDDDESTLTWAWLFGDGTCAAASQPAECSEISPSHTYDDDGEYEVMLTVSDGLLWGEATRTVTILNVAPLVAFGPVPVIDEGSLYSDLSSFIDANGDTWTATVDYDDGGGDEVLDLIGKTFRLEHTWADNGAYDVRVTVRDDDGGVGSGGFEATVQNVAPEVVVGPDATVTSGEPFQFTGSFDDAGVADAPWDWVVDWGFGPDTQGSTADQSSPILATRTVCEIGTYAVSLDVTDKDGGTGSDMLTLTVTHRVVAIDVSPGGTPNAVNLRSRGLLPVAILGDATFDAREVDLEAVTLGDGTGTETFVARKSNGDANARYMDVDDDGILDLLLMFETESLVANGDLTEASSGVVLRASMDDSCTQIQGEDSVKVVQGS